MSYIQIEIGGSLKGLKFNQYALEIFSKHYEQGSVIAYTYALIYAGLRGNSFAKREEPDYSFENVIDWVDGLPKETKAKTISDVQQCLHDTQLWKELLEVGKEVEDKKKVKKTLKRTGTQV